LLPLQILGICTLSVIGSFLFEGPKDVPYPTNNPASYHPNGTNGTTECLKYTGLSLKTFLENIKGIN